MPAVEIENLSIVFHKTPSLWNINLSIPKGKMVAIIGPNGAGKTTLIKAILGLIKPNTGSVRINNIEFNKQKNKHKLVSYIPQRDTINWDFPITCLDMVMMGRYGHIGWFKRGKKNEKLLALTSLEKFGMEHYFDRQIGELSDGQKQRVFLARMHVQDAEFLFLDEPFEGVDTKTEEITLQILKEFKNEGKTVLVVTHDLENLKEHFDYVVLLKVVLVAFGKTKDVLTSENLKRAYGGFLHMGNWRN